MTIAELKSNAEYTLHHTSSYSGYVSRKIEGIVKEYSGRFGTGYIVLRPRWNSTIYCYADYYIRKED